MNINNLKSTIMGKTIQKEIRESIQNIDDVFALNNTTKKEFHEKWKGFDLHEMGNALEVLIVAAYNEGKLPDWTDRTPKYYPWFEMGSSSGVGFSYGDYDFWYSNSDVGSRLVFIGENAKINMLDAVSKFLNEYKQSRTT